MSGDLWPCPLRQDSRQMGRGGRAGLLQARPPLPGAVLMMVHRCPEGLRSPNRSQDTQAEDPLHGPPGPTAGTPPRTHAAEQRQQAQRAVGKMSGFG